MRRKFSFAVVICVVLFCTGSIRASFTDNFNSYSAPQLPVTSMGDWRVYDGTVDLVGDGTGYEYYHPLGQVYYIDLVGASGTPGVLWTPGIPIYAGTTHLEVTYKLAGRQVQPSSDYDVVVLKVGVNIAGPEFPGTVIIRDEWQKHTVLYDQPFTEFYREDLVQSNFDCYIYIGFYNKSTPYGDVGALLDDVTVNVQTVPAPGALLLASIGTGLITYLRRRRLL